jgi:hypothetical protein
MVLTGSAAYAELPAGAVMLICLGLAMGFGFLVILRGARDL